MGRPRFASLAPTARLAHRLRDDEDGNVLVYVTLSAAVLLGIVGLALDGSRAMITHSEAQSAADAAALAAASQLDGQSGACDRAKAEALVVVNKQRFAQGGAGDISIASGSPVCLKDLPTSDAASTSGEVTTNDAASRYVQVTTQQLTHQNSLLDALSTDKTATIQRTAVAGFRRSLCAAAPVMMTCDTFAWTPGVAFDAWINDASLKGFVSDCGNSAGCVSSTLASKQASFCVVDGAMETVPGNKTEQAKNGINTRFGDGSSASEPSDTNITDFQPYSNDLTGGSGWNCAAYYAAHHASDGLAKPASCTSNTTSPTRYSVYQAERAADKIPTRGPAGKTTAEERRLLYLSIFDCTSSGSPPKAFLKAFMLRKAEAASQKHIYVEPIALVTSKTDPTAIHEEVQIYR
ncbi:pilus assembly protein TadG-related protein [Phenylobacterium sp. LjRoot219]|uniref:pilus assembly protein TadG-related protein n=1 Tax=Phenylobacterium sp. LjRoot219 TaxID=3342283 RepID=UPI003ED17059